MKRWHSLFDGMSASLKYYFILTLIFGIVGSFAFPVISSVIRFDTLRSIRLFEITRLVLNYLIQLFPFVVLVSLTQRKLKHSGAVVASIISAIIIYSMTLFIPMSQITTQYSFSLFNLTLSSTDFVSQPVQLGLVMTFISYQIVKLSISLSKKRIPYGFTGFIDSDTWVILYAIILSLVVGYLVVLIWPLTITGFDSIMRFIAQDITNPVNLFIYGMLEHVLILLNLHSTLHVNFWFSTLGGSWINPVGTLILGDVNIWNAQIASGIVPVGVGRFMSGWFVIQMFLIPAILWGMYFQFSDKFDTRRYRRMFILLTFASIFIGFRLPFEVFLVLAAPLLYIFYVLVSSMIFAITSALNISLGPMSFADLNFLLPGNGLHTLIYLKDPILSDRVWQLFTLGGVSFVVMGFITHHYYKSFAIDFIAVGNRQKSVEQILLAMGGLGNIKMVHSTFSKVYLQAYDKSEVDFNKVPIHGVSRIIENKKGFFLNFGGGSGMVRKEIMKLLIAQKQDEINFKSNES